MPTTRERISYALAALDLAITKNIVKKQIHLPSLGLQADNIQAFVERLANKNLKFSENISVNLENNDLGDEGVMAILMPIFDNINGRRTESFYNYISLVLNLKNTNLTKDGLGRMLGQLKSLTNVKSLTLNVSNNALSDDAVESITTYISDFPEGGTINLSIADCGMGVV